MKIISRWVKRWLFSAILFWSGVSLSQSAVSPNVTRGNFVKKTEYATQGALTLYVDPTGSDSNSCTSSGTAACLTIQAAVNRVPKRIRHNVTISVAAGTYSAGAYLDGFVLENNNGTAAGSGPLFSIEGVLANATVATGTATGTATGGTAGANQVFGTLVDAAQTWTVNNLKGKLLEITGGTGSGQIFPITENTATTVTVSGSATFSFWVSPDATSTYAIRDWSSIINNVLTAPAAQAAGTQAGASFFATGTGSPTAITVPTYTLKKLKFTSTIGMRVGGGGALACVNCRGEATTRLAFVGASGVFTLLRSSVLVAASQTGIGNFNNHPGAEDHISINVYNSLFYGASVSGTNQSAVFQHSVTGSMVYIIQSQLDTLTNGVVRAGSAGIQLTMSKVTNTTYGIFAEDSLGTSANVRANISTWEDEFSNNGTAFYINGPAFVSNANNLTGSGNTTVFNIKNGATVKLRSAGTWPSGTTEINIAGTAVSRAFLDGLSNKTIVDLSTLTSIQDM